VQEPGWTPGLPTHPPRSSAQTPAALLRMTMVSGSFCRLHFLRLERGLCPQASCVEICSPCEALRGNIIPPWCLEAGFGGDSDEIKTSGWSSIIESQWLYKKRDRLVSVCCHMMPCATPGLCHQEATTRCGPLALHHQNCEPKSTFVYMAPCLWCYALGNRTHSTAIMLMHTHVQYVIHT
jgi:hypothetical protein